MSDHTPCSAARSFAALILALWIAVLLAPSSARAQDVQPEPPPAVEQAPAEEAQAQTPLPVQQAPAEEVQAQAPQAIEHAQAEEAQAETPQPVEEAQVETPQPIEQAPVQAQAPQPVEQVPAEEVPARGPEGESAPPAGAAAGKEVVAVLPLDRDGVTREDTARLSDRIRQEVRNTGQFVLLEEEQQQAALAARGIQDATCAEQVCAVEFGGALGVDKIVAGKVYQTEEGRWLLTGMLVDVKTGQTIRTDQVEHSGDIEGLLGLPAALLATRLAGVDPGAVAAAPPSGRLPYEAPLESLPATQLEKEGGWPWWVWALIGVGVLGLAGGGGGGGGDEGSGGSGGSSTGGVTITW